MKWLLVFGLVSGLGLLGLLVWWNSQQSFILPEGEIKRETIILNDEGQLVDELPNNETDNQKGDVMKYEEKEIMVTDGVRHSVPLDEIVGGGPARDGIPSIDEPKFLSTAEVDFLSDEEPGIALSLNGIDRFYPFQILVWHEIVNDELGGQEVLVTYCPLCLSGVVFDPVVQGEQVEFGTSGKLWQSNLVMYDRKTDSLWSQILGEAIVGDATGSKLQILASDQTKYGQWRKEYPNGQVLSRDTGARRFYGSDPYGNYYGNNSQIISRVGSEDGRLENKDFVLGVVKDNQAKAYYPPSIKAKGEIRDNFAGRVIVAKYDQDLDAVRLYEEAVDGKMVRINPFPSFWFAWVAAHPDTDLYK